jgi:DNA-binding transcriptional LysR family regulator
MKITLRQLEVFEAVARNGSFTRAAEELHLSQPAVSMQIRQLEENLGLPMFEHIGKKFFLTDPGQEMFHYARRIAEILAQAEELLEESRDAERGRLSLSVATTAGYFATRLLSEFAARFPKVSYSLDVTNRETLLQQLENNERDMVIMGEPPGDMDLVYEPFMENPLVIVAPPDHPLAGQSDIPLAQFEQQRFVVRERGSGTRAAIERFFGSRKVAFHTAMELSSNEALKQAVQAGLGLGIVSIHTIELELEAGRLVLLDAQAFPIVRHWYIVHRQGKRHSPVARAFMDFVLQEARNYAPDHGEAMARGKHRAR